MRREAALYVHFLAALAAGAAGLWVAMAPLLIGIGLGLPGGFVIEGDDVRGHLAVGTVAAVLLFWVAGRWRPLHASLTRTALSGFAAWLVAAILIHVTARVEWLGGWGAVRVALLGLATLGYLPFRFADRA